MTRENPVALPTLPRADGPIGGPTSANEFPARLANASAAAKICNDTAILRMGHPGKVAKVEPEWFYSRATDVPGFRLQNRTANHASAAAWSQIAEGFWNAIAKSVSGSSTIRQIWNSKPSRYAPARV